MYTEITDPKTGKLVSIHSKAGKQIIQNYINFLNGGAVVAAAAAVAANPVAIAAGGCVALLAGGAWVLRYYRRRDRPDEVVGVAQLATGLLPAPLLDEQAELRRVLQEADEVDNQAIQLLEQLGGEPVPDDEQAEFLEEAENELDRLMLSDGEEDMDDPDELRALLDEEDLNDQDLEALIEAGPELSPEDEELLTEFNLTGGGMMIAAGITVTLVAATGTVWAILNRQSGGTEESTEGADSDELSELESKVQFLEKNIDMAQKHLDNAIKYKADAHKVFQTTNDKRSALPNIKMSKIQENARNQLCGGCEKLRKKLVRRIMRSTSLSRAEKRILGQSVEPLKQQILDIASAPIQ